MSKLLHRIGIGTVGALASGALALAMTMPASANVVPNARATNANVNPLAGYLAVGNGPNANFDHVEAYLGAQDKIGDLNTTLANGFGIGLCQSNATGTTSAALQFGIIQVSPGVYQMALGAGTLGPKAANAANNGDNCEDGALGNFVTGAGTPAPAGTAPPGTNCQYWDGTSETASGDPIAICGYGPTFSFGQVMEAEIQYLPNRGVDFSFRNITADNPGPWFMTGFQEGLCALLPKGVEFNEAAIGADSDSTNLVGPATTPFAPWAHATLSSFTFGQRHRADSGFFDTAPNGEWTALEVNSYPNGNTSDAAVLAGGGMHKGNGGVFEGEPVG